MANRGFVQLPGHGRVLDLGPFQMTVKAEAAATGEAVTVLEAAEPAHFGPPLHVHDDAAEAFYVLEGEYLIFIEEETYRCPAGSFIYIPSGVEHGFRVGEVQSKKLNIYLPGAMIGYFEELAAAEVAGVLLDTDSLTELAARHAMRVVGPVPDGYL
jgi:mannose-6-phosphate isomerase-like protein (cupin superfamily)